jgi:AraC-like DNA-binding protein
MSYDTAGLFAGACELLDHDLSRSLGELAERLGIHRHTLESIIRNQVGCNFLTWRGERRLMRARELFLERPPLLQKEIAAAVGLTPARLTALFRNRLHLTPTQVRQADCHGPSATSLRPTGGAKLAKRARKRTHG